jgi:hypothetical protein
VGEIVRRHLREIWDRFDERTVHFLGRTKWEPEPANQIFLDVPKPVTTLSAISDWPSSPEVPSSLKRMSEKALMNSIRQSLVGAKASAAFCCGGSIAFQGLDLGRHQIVQAAVAPVTLRWDDKQAAGCGKVVFSEAGSGDPQFQQALQQLCHASEPASFGRGGETVFDGKEPLHYSQREQSAHVGNKLGQVLESYR